MIDVGFKNYIDEKKIVSILEPNSSKAKWLIKDAISGRRFINCTQGKKASSLILLDTYHVILSSLKCNSIKKRVNVIDINKKELMN